MSASRPEHYQNSMETVEKMELVGNKLEEMGVGFLELNSLSHASKYFDRMGRKGDPEQDAQKCAQWAYRALNHGWYREAE